MTVEPQLKQLTQSAREQTVQVANLARSVSDRAFVERLDPQKWSMAEHVAHLKLVNDPYLQAMESAIERGTARGLAGAGPFEGKWFAARFIRTQVPPPKWRFRTFKEMKPAPYLNTAAVLADFEAVQQRFLQAAEAADGLHLGRITFRSPFVWLLRFTLLQGFQLLDAHNRRHIWHLGRMAGALS